MSAPTTTPACCPACVEAGRPDPVVTFQLCETVLVVGGAARRQSPPWFLAMVTGTWVNEPNPTDPPEVTVVRVGRWYSVQHCWTGEIFDVRPHDMAATTPGVTR